MTVVRRGEKVEYQKLKKVREIRDKLLAETDWTDLPNAPLSKEKKKEWAEYRDKLRNITDGFTIYKEVVWPPQPAKG